MLFSCLSPLPQLRAEENEYGVYLKAANEHGQGQYDFGAPGENVIVSCGAYLGKARAYVGHTGKAGRKAWRQCIYNLVIKQI